jgi:hypothetical protein
MLRWPSGTKWREWVWRYAPAELAAILTTYAGFHLVHILTRSLGAAAYGASIGENIGFYGWLLMRDWWRARRLGELVLGRVIKNLFLEFGLAELLDSLIIRPVTTFAAVVIFGPLAGVLIGKLAADLVFYLITITLYERRKARSGEAG